MRDDVWNVGWRHWRGERWEGRVWCTRWAERNSRGASLAKVEAGSVREGVVESRVGSVVMVKEEKNKRW